MYVIIELKLHGLLQYRNWIDEDQLNPISTTVTTRQEPSWLLDKFHCDQMGDIIEPVMQLTRPWSLGNGEDLRLLRVNAHKFEAGTLMRF
jgi:hypothetical protein